MESRTHPTRRPLPGRIASVISMLPVLAAAWLLFAADVSRAHAQTLATGTITGVVRDEAGRPLNGVVITITNRASGQRMITRTSRSGTYGSDLLAPGRYDALFESLGYEPLLTEDILVTAGTRRDLQVRLTRASGNNIQSHRVPAPNAAIAASGQAGPSRYVTTGASAASMPFDGEGLSALLRVSTLGGPRRDIEGLPVWMHGALIDGIPLVRRPRALSFLPRDAGLPLTWFGHAGLVTTDIDVEYPGAAGGYLTGFTRRGGRETTLHAFGDFASDATTSAAGIELEPFDSYRAGAVVQGSIIRDTASYVIGAEIMRSRTPFAPFWPADSSTTRVVDLVQNEFERDVSTFSRPALSTLDREAAFARLDFPFSDNASFSVRGFFSQIPEPEVVAPWSGVPLASGITPRFREIFGTASLVTRIDDELMGELNVGFESARTTQRSADERNAVLPATTIVGAGRAFGSNETTDIGPQHSAFYIRGTLHIQSGTHWRKLGLMAWLPNYEIPLTINRASEFVFANLRDFQDSFGYFRRLDGSQSIASFSMRKAAIVAQDSWRPNPGLELMAGLRLTAMRMVDSTDITPNNAWFRLTGITTRPTIPRRMIDLEPRFVLTLNPGGRDYMQLRAGVSIDADFADPGVIAEAINNNGGYIAVAGFGQLRRWPEPSNDPEARPHGNTLSVLGPEFRGPRTTRGFGSLSFLLGSQGVLSAAVSVRRTEFLPQRVDLNLQPVVSARDQFDRPIFGKLQKRGAMLYAELDANRRFANFEHVWGLQATGESRYVGVSFMAERPLAGPVGLFASYTYSKTEDNWLIGDATNPFTQLAPFPDNTDPTDWEDGRSDLDVPHRFTLGAEARWEGSGPLSATLAGLYRYQSGYPFTPGFRPGVDANADGSWYNDPAFIDDRVPGMQALLDAWPCLRLEVGQFASRNACRGPSIKSLDARLAVTFRRGPRHSATLVVDGLNLIASDDGLVDRAVYLVDPDTDLVFNEDGTSVTVPLVANPDFGKLITRFRPERQLRLGLRVNF